MDKLEVEEKNSGSPKCGCGFLVTDGKKIFEIDEDFEVLELSKYGQIGCTDRIALAVILNAMEECSPNEIILKALRTSSYRDDGVGVSENSKHLSKERFYFNLCLKHKASLSRWYPSSKNLPVPFLLLPDYST